MRYDSEAPLDDQAFGGWKGSCSAKKDVGLDVSQFNDIPVVKNMDVYDRLLREGLDELLAQVDCFSIYFPLLFFVN